MKGMDALPPAGSTPPRQTIPPPRRWCCRILADRIR